MGVLPRTSLPRPLSSWAEYDRLLAAYRRMNFIKNGSELWWDIRPSQQFPTVEMRICDLCPRLDDMAGIAALYASLVRRLLRLDRAGRLPVDPPVLPHELWPFGQNSCVCGSGLHSCVSALPIPLLTRTSRSSHMSSACWRSRTPKQRRHG